MRLADDYAPLFAQMDLSLMLRLTSFECVHRWRAEQAARLPRVSVIGATGYSGNHAMSPSASSIRPIAVMGIGGRLARCPTQAPLFARFQCRVKVLEVVCHENID